MPQSIEIDIDILAELVSQNLPARIIAEYFGVSQRTIERRKWEYNIYYYNNDISEQELESVLTEVCLSAEIGEEDGYRQVAACLRSHNINVGEHRVRKALRRLFPAIVQVRTNWIRNCLRRFVL